MTFYQRLDDSRLCAFLMSLFINICCKIPLAVIVLLIAIAVPSIYLNLHEDERFAIMRTHTSIVNPNATHTRYRMDEYAHLDNYFFQWWNFLVFDSETRHHYNFIYVLTNFSSTSNSRDTASVSMAHLQSNERVNVVTDTRPLSYATVTKYANVDIFTTKAQDSQPAYRLEFSDSDDTISIKAKFNEDMSLDQNIETEWDVTFTRVHGVYLSSSTEHSNHDSVDGCLVVSNLFAYNSLASGYVKENGKINTFDSSNRYRAYAAGSWGCSLPSGSPPVSYPWTWFWLVIPSAFPSGDLSFVFGTAKFQSSVLGDVYGMYSVTGLPSDIDDTVPTGIWSTQQVDFNHNSSNGLDIPLMASASDTYLSTYDVKLQDWAPYADEYGSAVLPLVQIYHVSSRCHVVDISFTSTLSQYFRAPVAIEKSNQLRVFSDFRAVGVHTDIVLTKLARCSTGAGDEVLYRGTVDSMNALEFAYEPDMDIQKWSKFSGRIRD